MRFKQLALAVTMTIGLSLAAQPIVVQGAAAVGGGAVLDLAACTQHELSANDDQSSELVNLPFSLNFYGTSHEELWVNNNGNVTFDRALGTYTPFGLIGAQTPIIAPFFADVDTRGVGSNVVMYGYGETSFEGHDAFCASWVDVGYFSGGTDKLNSFQLLLVDRPDKGDGAFDAIFNYDKIQWEAGGASGGSGGLGGYTARAGFSSGSETIGASLELLGSGVPGAFLDSSPTGLIHHSENSTVNGRYVYQVRGGTVVADNYVALGDSFQSGEGDYNSYEAGTDQSGNYCHRSPNAYPHLLSKSVAVELNLDFRACSGALIDDLSQTTTDTEGAPWNEGAQLDALGADTRLVTVGIGGNDAKFASTIEDCVKSGIISFLLEDMFAATPCAEDLDEETEETLTSLDRGAINTKLQELYREIRTRAPYARVVVVSYPRFFPLEGVGIPFTCSTMRPGDQQWMNDAVIQADGSIGVAAVRSGFDYVNMANALEGHEMCTRENGISPLALGSPNGIATPESFHPNRLGHSIMAAEIEDLIAEPVEPTFVIRPGERLTRTIAVDAGDVHVNSAWPGSDVETTLISPSGVRYDRANLRGAAHGNGPTYEYWDIENAENGIWSVEIFGADVDPAGEPVIYSAYATPRVNQKPNAQFNVSGSGTEYRFDATSSTDPDGTLTDYTWDFGDGTVAHGSVVDHTFPNEQEFKVMLRVTDDQGAQDFTSSSRLIGAAGSWFSSSTILTDNVTINGPLHVDGDLNCNTSARIVGNVFVSGNLTMTTNCRIEGNVLAGGSVSMNSQAEVTGAFHAIGDASVESTNVIGGNVILGGALTPIGNKTIDELRASGTLTGELTENYEIPPIHFSAAPSAVASAADHPGFRPITWATWMNETARANEAPTWSAGLTSSPGCAMAPWPGSVNGSTVRVSGDTLIDSRLSGCSNVSLQGMSVELSGDLTIFADRFTSTGTVAFSSADSLPHRVTIVVPGERNCESTRSVDISAGTTSAPEIVLDVDASGKLSAYGTTAITGKAAAGCFAGSGDATVGR